MLISDFPKVLKLKADEVLAKDRGKLCESFSWVDLVRAGGLNNLSPDDLLRFRKVSLQIELTGNESLSHRRRAQRAQRLSAWALRSLRLCGGERGLHQALLELCKLIYLKLNKSDQTTLGHRGGSPTMIEGIGAAAHALHHGRATAT